MAPPPDLPTPSGDETGRGAELWPGAGARELISALR